MPFSNYTPEPLKGWPPPLRWTLPLILMGLGLAGVVLQVLVSNRVLERQLERNHEARLLQQGRHEADLIPRYLQHGGNERLHEQLRHLVEEHDYHRVSLLDQKGIVTLSSDTHAVGKPFSTDLLNISNARLQLVQNRSALARVAVEPGGHMVGMFAVPGEQAAAWSLSVELDFSRSLQGGWAVVLRTGVSYLIVTFIMLLVVWVLLRLVITKRLRQVVQHAQFLATQTTPMKLMKGRDEFAQIDHALMAAHKLIAQKEQTLRENEKHQAKLAKDIAEVAEAEKRRIGQDLHDDICQRLAALKISMQDMEEGLAESSPSLLMQADGIVERLDEAIQTTRGLARGLSPVEIDSGGLNLGLEALCQNAKRLHGLQCRLETDLDLSPLPNQLATQLYRIAQECISNAAKHGKATQAVIRVQHEDDVLRLCVENDGAPFEPDFHGPGMGLQIMRHRAASIGARLTFLTHGTDSAVTVCCELNWTTAEASTPNL
jgi:signal transduction histidine kinase